MVRAAATIGNESTGSDVSDTTPELPPEVQLLLRNVALDVVKSNPGATAEDLKNENRSRIKDLLTRLRRYFSTEEAH